MSEKGVIRDWLVEALTRKGGKASLVDVCRYIWEKHESDLRGMGDNFYTWQYDVRWAATSLRKMGKMLPSIKGEDGRSIWSLSSHN